jgi:hypothetical protein
MTNATVKSIYLYIHGRYLRVDTCIYPQMLVYICDGLVRSHAAKNAANWIFDHWRLPQHLMAAITRCNRSLTAQDNEEKVPIGAGFPSVSRFRYAAARIMLIAVAFKYAAKLTADMPRTRRFLIPVNR